MKFLSRLVRPTIATAVMAALIAAPDTRAVVPLACGVTWTMVGGTIIFLPDCKSQPPPPPPSPEPPPDPNIPPDPPPTP